MVMAEEIINQTAGGTEMDISDILMLISIIINCVAILIAPIISIHISQKLQDRDKKRQDKLDVFKTLMTCRIYGWTPQSVNALNIINVVFADEPDVIEQWNKYYKALWVNNPDDKQLQTIKEEQETLLLTMAKVLGYKDQITLQTIQKPYMPAGMSIMIEQENKYRDDQSQAMSLFVSMLKNQNGGNTNGQNENGIRKPNGRKHK